MKKYVLIVLFLFAGLRVANAQCTADAGQNQILNCATTSVTLSGSSNIPGATYSWAGPGGYTSTQQNPTTSLVGQYTLTITDLSNGCTATASTLVLSDVAAPSVSVQPAVLTCLNPTATLTAIVTPFNCVYNWTGPNGFNSFLQNPVVSSPGTYFVVVTNPVNGCTSTAAVTVTYNNIPITVSASSGQVGCTPANLNLFCGTNPPLGVAYQWAGPNNFISTVQNPVIVNATAANVGMYTVTVTDANGCTGTASTLAGYDASVPKATANITNVDCILSPLGDIDITASGGTPPYLYSWAGPNNFAANTEDITDAPAGAYQLVLTDQTGCSGVYTFVIAQPAPMNLVATATPNSCSGTNDGSAVVTVSGGAPPYAFLWSHGVTTPAVNGLAAGTYTVTATDANGCTAQTSVVVNQSASLVITNSLVCEDLISVQITGGTPPFLYQWSNGSTFPTLPGAPPGNYTVTIIDANGCSATATYAVDPSTTPCTRIVGKVTLDENLNCQANVLEPGLGGWFVKASGANGTFYGVSDSTGHYVVSVLPGDYAVVLIPQGYLPVICVDELHVILQQTGDSVVINYPVQLPNPDCPALSVSLGTPNLRRCFNSYYYLNYCNNSPATATGAYVTLELDPLLSIVNSQKPYTPLGNNTYSFSLGDLTAFQCGSFWVQVYVSCNAVLGQTHCSTAHIYPDTLCDPPNAQWSGAQVEISSECAGDSLKFTLKNIGASDMTQPLDYIVIEDGIMTLQGSSAPLAAGGTMIVSVPASGSTWYVEANQEPFAPASSNIAIGVEGCTVTGTFSTGFVNQFVLGDQEPWIDINCTPNTGSYDPNDKQGFPAGYGPNHYIRPGTELEYLIRFQNTGTDTAFNVVIRDTLSAWFDPTSIQPGAGSHPYRFTLDGKGILIFNFENILLPDSNVNEAASHGFVQFRVKPRADVPLETDIPNNAAIYFDFNDPVITNTTQHRVGENFVAVWLWEPRKPEYKVQVAPHPVAEASWITLDGWDFSGNPASGFHLHVFDATGRTTRDLEAAEPRFLLHKNDLEAGLYFFRIERDGVLLGSGKLVVRG